MTKAIRRQIAALHAIANHLGAVATAYAPARHEAHLLVMRASIDLHAAARHLGKNHKPDTRHGR